MCEYNILLLIELFVDIVDSVENSSSCKRQRVMHSNSKESSMQELHQPLTNGDSFSKYIDVKEIENQSKERNCSALSPESDCDDSNVHYDLYAVSVSKTFWKLKCACIEIL